MGFRFLEVVRSFASKVFGGRKSRPGSVHQRCLGLEQLESRDLPSVFFTADDGTRGRELWKSDGTEAGTEIVKDINAGGDSDPDYLTTIGNTTYFLADDGQGYYLWKTDGTANGTVKVQETGQTSDLYKDPDLLTKVGNKLYFVATNKDNQKRQLWNFIPSSNDYGEYSDFLEAGNDAQITEMVAGNDTLYFNGTDGQTGIELWKAETPDGISLVKDLAPGAVGGTPNSSNPTELTYYAGSLFFSAITGVAGSEPWVSDGSAVGTNKVAFEVVEGGQSSVTNPIGFTGYNGWVYFAAAAPNTGIELYRAHASGVLELWANLNPGGASSDPEQLTVFDGRLWFVADTGGVGKELFSISDNPVPDLVLEAELRIGPIGSQIRDITVTSIGLFFVGNDGNQDGLYLKEMSGQNVTLRHWDIQVSDLFFDSNAQKLFFSSDIEANKMTELYAMDLVSIDLAIELVRDINGMGSSNPSGFHQYN